MVTDRSLMGTHIVLPSYGLPYQDKIPGGEVVVTAWSTREQMLMSGSSPAKYLQGINLLLERCVPTLGENGMKPEELLSTDRVFLLIMARTASHGDSYPVHVRCTVCGFSISHTYTLPDDLDVYYLQEDFQEPFETVLPVSGETIGLRLLRGYDEQNVMRYTERLAKHAQDETYGDPAYTYRMAHHILYVKQGEQVRENKTSGDMGYFNSWYGNLHPMDETSIRQSLADNDCGFDVETDVNCSRCNHTFAVGLPMSDEFFRPGGKRKRSPGRAMDSNPTRRGSLVGQGGANASVGTQDAPVQVEETEGRGGES